MLIPLTIDEDDLMTEKHQDIPRLKSTWMGRVGESALFISATNKREFRRVQNEVYAEHIHNTVSLTISFISRL
jgi:GTP-binding protein HflX